MPREPFVPGLGHLLIGQSSLASFVSRSLATKGEQPETIESRYNLSISALDLTDPEFRWLARRVSFNRTLNVPAVAGQLGIFAMSPPPLIAGAPRQLMVVVERVILTNPSAAALGFFFGVGFGGAGGVGAGAVTGFPWDDRAASVTLGTVQTSAAQCAVGSNAADPFNGGASGGEFVQLAVNASLEVRGPWILTNNGGGAVSAVFMVVGNQSNTAFRASIRWYERELLSSEQ